MDDQKIDPIGYTLLSLLFVFLCYAGFLAYKSIDWGVLKRLESQTLVLPTQAPLQQTPTLTHSSSTPSPTQ